MTPAAAKSQHVPRRAGTIVMWLFLGSLAVLFLSSMVGYVIIRVRNGGPDAPSVKLPSALWVSTLMMLASSYTMERSLRAIRREKQSLFRTYLASTLVFALVFVVIQTPAMVKLVQQHWVATTAYQQRIADLPPPTPDPSIRGDEVIENRRGVPPYALTMVLILIHALHVVGGMVALGLVAYHGYQGRYDHEHYTGVAQCVLYWHFLDGVWLFMFAVIGAFG